MADIQHDLDVPHRVNIDGQMVEIAEFQARVYCDCLSDGWTIERAEVDGFDEAGRRRMINVPRTSVLFQSIRDAAAKSDELEDKYTEFMWEHRRFGRTDREEHGQFGRTM